MPRARQLAWMAAGIVAGCAAAPPPPPAPDVTVYVGPRQEIPDELKARHRLEREQWVGFHQQAEHVLALVRNDPAFAGFLLRGSPEPHAIVMFTGDAQARLRRYTTDRRFHARTVELTLVELERMKDAMADQLARLGLTCFTVDGDEERNRVTVGAPPAELEKVRAAIADGRMKPPPKLRLVTGACPQFR